MLSETVRADAREGDIGMQLGDIARANPEVVIGSHPFFDPQHGPNTNVVLRARDVQTLARAKRAVEDMLERVARGAIEWRLTVSGTDAVIDVLNITRRSVAAPQAKNPNLGQCMERALTSGVTCIDVPLPSGWRCVEWGRGLWNIVSSHSAQPSSKRKMYKLPSLP
jgi:hypothetical protein